MKTLRLVGIASGHPDHLTPAAAAAIRDADLILIPSKGAEKADLAHLRETLVCAIRGNLSAVAGFDMPQRDPDAPYLDAVEAWHDAIAARWTDALSAHAGAQTVVLLVWGDPSLYDSTLRIAGRLQPRPEIDVIPGLTSLQLLTAAHGIALNTVGGAVTITTGRRLARDGWTGEAESVAVMLDGNCAFRTLDAPDLSIWWGAFLGMPQQILMSGPLRDVGQEIVAARAAARERHGWIMDTYLLRRHAT